MKTLKNGLIIFLLISSIPVFIISQKAFAVDNKNGNTISALRDKITIEREAIIADSRKLAEAKKTGDKTKIEQVKQETSQDIDKRKARIKAIYEEMGNKTKSDGGKKKKNKWAVD